MRFCADMVFEAASIDEATERLARYFFELARHRRQGTPAPATPPHSAVLIAPELDPNLDCEE